VASLPEFRQRRRNIPTSVTRRTRADGGRQAPVIANFFATLHFELLLGFRSVTRCFAARGMPIAVH
jgi:hypothetical protein